MHLRFQFKQNFEYKTQIILDYIDFFMYHMNKIPVLTS